MSEHEDRPQPTADDSAAHDGVRISVGKTDEPEVEQDFQPDGVDYKLDPNWVQAQRLSAGISAAVLGIVTLIGLLISVFLSDWRGPTVLLAFAGWFVVIATIATITLVLPAKRYRRRRYRLSETELRIVRGLLWHVEISVPYSRIQHTDVSRGPIERSFGLATLVVHTAGTQNASVSLDGLPAARAYRIRDLLLGEVESADAV